MIAITPSLRRALAAAAVLAAAGAMAGPATAQDRIGVNSAVNPEASGTPPGAGVRRLVIGQDVVFNEQIATTASGQTQILFVDGSAISVGPNSDMVIDKFVYQPKTNTGTLAVSATRGIFRFVGGQLSKGDNSVSMATGVATIGIRGGVFLVDLTRDGKLEVVFLYGKALTITTRDGQTRTLFRPGYAILIDGPNAAPSQPFLLPDGIMTAFLNQFDGRPGQSGGASRIPTDITVSQSGVHRYLTETAPQDYVAVNQHLPLPGQPPRYDAQPTNSFVNNLNVSTVQGQGFPTIENGYRNPPAQGSRIPNVNQPPPTTTIPPPVTTTPPPVTTVPPVVVNYAGGFESTNGAGTALGFTGQPISYAAGTLVNGVFSATLNDPGTVTIPLAPGTSSFGSAGTTSPLGPVTGTSYLSPDGTFFYADLTPVNAPADREFIYGGMPVNSSFYTATAASRVSAFAVQPDAALQSAIPFIRSTTGGGLANPVVSPFYIATPVNSPFAPSLSGSSTTPFSNALQASLAINGQGAAQTSVIVVAVGSAFSTSLNGSSAAQPILNGVVNGSYLPNANGQPIRIASNLVTGSDGNGTSFYGANAISGFVLNQNGCCSGTGGQVNTLASEINTSTQATTNYQFAQPATAITLPPGVATAPQTTQTLTGYFGGTQFAQPSGVPYVLAGTTSVSTNASTLQIASTFTGADPFTPTSSGVSSATLQFGTLQPGQTAGRQSFINDQLFAALESPTTASQYNGINAVDANGNPLGASHIFMVNSNAVPSTSLLPAGVSFCACQFLQWGYWGGEVDTPAQGTFQARADIGNINTWVAGQPSTSLPTSGVGTFTGAAIGSVNNNGATYLAAGGFSNTYNFGTLRGTVAITNFDGRNFGGTVTAGAGATYSGPLAGANLSGTANGTFYGPLGAETGGNFSVQSLRGAPYLASGIFAGKQ